MKKILTIFLILCPFISFAEEIDSIKLQMLDSEIEKYTKIRDEKYEELLKCEKSTKGFKIAGITTLIATGVGVYGNIKLSQKLKGKTSGDSKSARVIDNRPQEEKNDDSCGVLCDAGIGEEAGCSC